MPLTIDDVQDVLSQEIEIASEEDKKLTFCPLTQRFNVLIKDKSIWPEGERNVIYAISHYNDLEVMGHAG